MRSPVVESTEYLRHVECVRAAVAGEVHVALGHGADLCKVLLNIQGPRDHRELAKGGAALFLVVGVNFSSTFKESTFFGKLYFDEQFFHPGADAQHLTQLFGL